MRPHIVNVPIVVVRTYFLRGKVGNQRGAAERAQLVFCVEKGQRELAPCE